MSDARRGVAARLGIVALNLVGPGLGLLRIGKPRLAAVLLLISPAASLLVLCFYAFGPPLSFRSYTIVAISLLLIFLSALIASAVLSWRGSALRRPLRWWSRWYVILGTWLALLGAGEVVVSQAHSHYKPYYLPAASMAPSMMRNDRIIADMRDWGELRRGDVILVRAPAGVYVKRVAALPGDWIAMEGGHVILNGRGSAAVHRHGPDR